MFNAAPWVADRGPERQLASKIRTVPRLPADRIARLREVVDEPDLSGTRYRLLEPIGRGGMGAVYLAEDATLGRRVAIKVLHPEMASPEAVARMLREARTLAALEHPGIVPVHDAGLLADGRAFCVMKWVKGHRLDEFQAPLADRLRVFERICQTVAFAHSRGVIHRDLKPANVMVGAFGEVLVLDWGIAKWLDQPESPALPSTPGPATQDGAIVGTAEYMAPEQSRGEAVDPRSDVYALGTILRDLLDPAVPKALRAIAAKATSPAPEHRYENAQSLAEEVARYLDGLAVTAHAETVLDQALRLLSRHRAAVLLVLAYLVMRMLLLWFRSL